MRTFLALLVLSIAPQVSLAAPILGTLHLVKTNVATFDPSTFTAGPTTDVYHVVVFNPTAGNVTSLELSFPGAFLNFNSSGIAFKDTTIVDPRLGPNTVPESFFVLPAGFAGDQLAVNTIDDETGLFSSFTLPGSTSLIDAGATTVVAVLSVLAGTVPDAIRFSGRAVIDGAFQDIRFPVPEPTTALLILLGVAGFVVRRRC